MFSIDRIGFLIFLLECTNFIEVLLFHQLQILAKIDK